MACRVDDHALERHVMARDREVRPFTLGTDGPENREAEREGDLSIPRLRVGATPPFVLPLLLELDRRLESAPIPLSHL